MLCISNFLSHAIIISPGISIAASITVLKKRQSLLSKIIYTRKNFLQCIIGEDGLFGVTRKLNLPLMVECIFGEMRMVIVASMSSFHLSKILPILINQNIMLFLYLLKKIYIKDFLNWPAKENGS